MNNNTSIGLEQLMHAWPHVLYAMVIFAIGLSIAYMAKKICLRLIRHQANSTLSRFVVNFVYITVLSLVVIITLTKLGVPTASLIAILGASSLAIGFALKDFLANIAAGLILIILRPFQLGDFVDIDGRMGTVVDINLFVTALKTPANEALIIPNGQLINRPIMNKTYYETKRLDINIGVSYSADIKQVKQLLQNLIQSQPLILTDPSPLIALGELGDSAVNLILQLWVHKQDYANVHYELLENIKQSFDKAGIDIPFPQVDVHLNTRDAGGIVNK